MPYTKTNWQDYPDTSTPITSSRLNNLETQYDSAIQDITPLLAQKADLSSGKVPVAQLPTSTTTTTNTLPVRSTSGRIPGVGTPTAASDAAPKSYVDNSVQGLIGTAASSGSLRYAGGCLRRVSSTSWEILSDSGHTSVGLASVSIVSNSFLRLTYDFTASKVITASVTMDEAFAGAGNVLKVGPSVGLSYMDIYLYYGPTTTTPTDPGTLSTPNANLWVSCLLLV